MRLATLLLLILTATVDAQWAKYVPPGTPMKDGKPDVAAPTPKTADGHTDFTGVWDYMRPPGAPAPRPAAATTAGGGLGPVGRGGVNQFFNIGSTLEGGQLPFQPWAAKLRAERVAANNKDNPDAHCLPMGFMQFHTHPQPRKIIQTPTTMMIVYEANYGLRTIFMDGRKLPTDPNTEDWWYGYSVGHWEGDTLVVETTHVKDLTWLDVEGSPLTNQGKVTERMHRTNYGNMETEITVNDPKAYTKPWTVKVYHKIAPDDEIIEFICNENERDVPHLTEK